MSKDVVKDVLFSKRCIKYFGGRCVPLPPGPRVLDDAVVSKFSDLNWRSSIAHIEKLTHSWATESVKLIGVKVF